MHSERERMESEAREYVGLLQKNYEELLSQQRGPSLRKYIPGICRQIAGFEHEPRPTRFMLEKSGLESGDLSTNARLNVEYCL